MKQSEIKCPCCNETITISTNEDGALVSCKSEAMNEIEVSQALDELNIVFG